MLLWAVVVPLLALSGLLVLGRVPDNRRMRTRLATPSLVIGISALLLTALVAVLSVTTALDAIPGRDVLAAVGFLRPSSASWPGLAHGRAGSGGDAWGSDCRCSQPQDGRRWHPSRLAIATCRREGMAWREHCPRRQSCDLSEARAA